MRVCFARRLSRAHPKSERYTGTVYLGETKLTAQEIAKTMELMALSDWVGGKHNCASFASHMSLALLRKQDVKHFFKVWFTTSKDKTKHEKSLGLHRNKIIEKADFDDEEEEGGEDEKDDDEKGEEDDEHLQPGNADKMLGGTEEAYDTVKALPIKYHCLTRYD